MRSAFAALLAAVAFAASAQILPSAITGRVTAGDAPAAGVIVTATSRARQRARTATTSGLGTYWIDALEPGTYDVTFSRAGLTSLSRPAIVELGRIARADARLEASDDEETVTSTARTVSVAEWTSMTTHFTGEELDRMPIGRQTYAAEELAPGYVRSLVTVLDDAQLGLHSLLGEEVLDETTVFRGNLPIEAERHPYGVVVARTRSGGDDFFLALRDSISSERWFSDDAFSPRDTRLEHLFESASSGRAGRVPLWFFAAGWSGDAPERFIDDLNGFEIKLSSQLAAAHQLTALHLDGESVFPGVDPHVSLTSLRYSGVLSERFTAEAVAFRSRRDIFGFSDTGKRLTTRVSYVLPSTTGDHVLSAGASAFDDDGWSLFLGDRWSAGRWFVDAGVRYEEGDGDDELTPRVGVTFDLRGNGRHALIASYGRYGFVAAPFETTPLATLGYAIAIGSSGSVRADVLRREYDAGGLEQIQLDARYRLFDRLDLGANYTWTSENRVTGTAPYILEDVANAWAGIELPVGEHVFGATLLQRFYSYEDQNHTPSDLALRYSIPIRRTVATVAADVRNVLDTALGPYHSRRTVRLWLRLRV